MTPGPPPHSRSDAGFWASLSPTARHGVMLTLLLTISLAFFAPVHFQGQGLHGSDIIQWRGMAEAMIEYEEATGEDALWAPNVFGGMPGYLINYKPDVPQIDTVVNAVRSFLWPTSHLFLLFAGVYALVFYLTKDSFAGFAASVAYGLTTYLPIILAAGHQTKFVALCYAPLVLLAFVYALRNPRLISGLFFAIALAAQLRAKHPQISYYVLMLALVWWIVEGVRAVRKGETAAFAQSTGWLALGTGLGLLMVVQPYWATYEYKQFSTRAAEAAAGESSGAAMSWEYAMRWSQGAWEMITLAIADAFGGGGRLYWGPKPFTAGPHYVGGAVLALAGFAVWHVRSRVTWGLGLGALVTAFFAMGRHFPLVNRPMYEVFPFFDAFRAPETWLSITALALAVLAGIGLDAVLRRPEDNGRRRRSSSSTPAVPRSLLVSFGVVAGLVVLLWMGKGAFFDFQSQREAQIIQQVQQNPNLSRSNPRVQQFYRQIEQAQDQRREKFDQDALRTVVVLIAVGLILWLYRRKTIPSPWIAGTLVAVVILIDLWGVAGRYLGEDEFSRAQSVERLMPRTDVDRWIQDRQREAGGSGHFRVLPLQTPYSQSPMNNATSSYKYESIGGYHGAKLQVYQDYIDHILQIQQDGPNENALDLMNTRYIVAQQPLPGTTVAYRSERSGYMVLENPDALPRGFFVGQTEVIDDPQATWQRLRSPDFDPSTTALLEDPLDASVTPLDSTSTTSVTLQTHTPREITWTVQTDAPRLFVASEVYYPAGWTATLDGETVPIHRVDYLLRGVHVPAGEHTLTMRFDPAVDRVGTWITAGATTVVYGGVAVLLGLRYRRREDEGTEVDDASEEE